MSLIPYWAGNALTGYDPWECRRHCPRRNQLAPWDHFGLGVSPSEIQMLTSFPAWLQREANQLNKNIEKDLPQPIIGKDGFQVHMDVQQFKPSEVTVKVVDDSIIVEGKHEDREDEHGYISRHFVRKYKLPKNYDSQHVVSSLSSDGVLTIKAPPPVQAIEGKERVVQIQQTGPAHLNVKENKADEK